MAEFEVYANTVTARIGARCAKTTLGNLINRHEIQFANAIFGSENGNIGPEMLILRQRGRSASQSEGKHCLTACPLLGALTGSSRCADSRGFVPLSPLSTLKHFKRKM
jgi:hypothetical protein